MNGNAILNDMGDLNCLRNYICLFTMMFKVKGYMYDIVYIYIYIYIEFGLNVNVFKLYGIGKHSQ